MKGLIKIAIFLIGMFWQMFVIGQTEANAILDTNAILIGDQTILQLQFSCPADYEVFWPMLNDTITSQIEILKHTELSTDFSNNQYDKLYRQSFTVTSFDSGYLVIPPFRFNYKAPGDTNIHFTESEPLLLQVNTVTVNMEQDFKDIKDPMHAPFTFREALPYLLGLLAALFIGFGIWYYIRKRKKAEPVFKAPAARKIPPPQLAIEALESLRHQKLWQKGEIKQYHTELTDIIREYLLGNFAIHALEYTTEEIMSSINATTANSQAKEKLHQMLVMADLVKFAKMQPLPLEHDGSLNNALDFVRETAHLNNKTERPASESMPFDASLQENTGDQKMIEDARKEVKDAE